MDAQTLKVDRRELSTIVAALHLLQEQMPFLPEDLTEMLSGHGRAVTEADVGALVARLGALDEPGSSTSIRPSQLRPSSPSAHL